MKRIYFPIIILLSVFQSLQAQIDTVYIDCPGIAGGTWSNQHRYIARCDVFVPYDSVLTIEAGVKIEFQDGYEFKVEGQLHATGNSNGRIEITSADESWEGITFGTPSGEMNMNTSLLSYVDIDCGGNDNNSEAIVVGKHKIVSINNIRISNAEKGIRATGFATIDNITNCSFTDVSEGITFQYCDVVSDIIIQNCIFENIRDRGVIISQNQAFLESVLVSGCNFDNSGAGTNISQSAVFITLNNKLTSVSLVNNDFNSFGLLDNSTAAIYIFDNDMLESVSLEQNEVTLCGGEAPTSPNADFGGLYVNESASVYLEDNVFSDNTGKKSGAGYLKAGKIYFSENDFLDNRNSYSGNENFGGAFTITAGDRLESSGDNFAGNVSAKSGGAMYIESKSNSNPIDLLFTQGILNSNGASNEGGAILVNASLDSLYMTGSEISGNYSSAGSGGCLSVISAACNDLTLSSNTITNNFVSENSDGGFLFLRHDPSLVPVYGNFKIEQNTCSVTTHNTGSNYSLIYSKIKSFPQSISVLEENVSGFYPVEGNLYHFELLEAGPAPSDQTIALSLQGNVFQNNQCPLFYFSHDLATISADFTGNQVEGNSSTIGNFFTGFCKETTELSFEGERYANLVSAASGGAVSISAVREIGAVTFNDVISQDCFCIEGNGGHFSLVSGSSNPSAPQSVSVTGSAFVNELSDDESAGNGGAIYYYTPGNLASATFTDCNFSSLRTELSGGALYIESSAIDAVSFLGAEFEWIFSNEGDGAVCIKASNGNINSVSLIPDIEEGVTFNACHGQLNGGAMSVTASKEIGSITIDNLLSIDCSSWEGNGMHLYFNSQGSDPAVLQNITIAESSFEANSLDAPGNNGGAIFYKTGGDLSQVDISNSYFENTDISGNGAGLFIEAKSITAFDIFHTGFYGLGAGDARGGAVYLNAFEGNIGQMKIEQAVFNGCFAEQDGGAFFANASGEIGTITMDSVSAEGNFSAEGHGGHFAFISGSSQSNPQQISINRSLFDNTGITNATGGNGGAIYYKTPGDLSSLSVTTCSFDGLKAKGKAGALYLSTSETGTIDLLGAAFAENTSLDTAGAIYFEATGGKVGRLRIAPYEGTPSTFTSCNSKFDGGAICGKASLEIGEVVLDTVSFTKCFSDDGNGGHISLTSLGSDPLPQSVSITGSVFSNEGLSSITGGNGGMIYYKAYSDLVSVAIAASEFSEAKAVKDGGSLYFNVGKITTLDVSNSLYTSSVSQVLSGGALYIRTNNGILDGTFSSNRFIDCASTESGGAIYIEDLKYDNASEHIAWTGNTYRRINTTGTPESGGAIFCKGINQVSFHKDSTISQVSSDKGGFLYLEKVYGLFFDSVYTYSNSSRNGGVVYHNGDVQSAVDYTARFLNSTFLFNQALDAGGCVFITGVDSVEIGREGMKNTFVANQSLSELTGDQLGGGVMFVRDAVALQVGFNSFYVNKSGNNGGIGLVGNVSSSLLISGNSLLSNQAKAGGAFAFIDSFGDGVITGNMFSHNSAAEQAGALLFSPSAAAGFQVHDNTFYKNNTGKLGGAVASYRPVNLIRNLFRENNLTDINPNVAHKGTTVYLGGEGGKTMIKNCVFDQNYYEENPAVASVFFDSQSGYPEYNISNCSFFNFSDDHYSVYNANGQDTVLIQNSIFTQRQNIANREAVVYFNETVKSMYCDLIYSEINDPVNHNVDEYVYFNVGDYFFDETQYPVDQGNPDPAFNDFHMPPGYGTERNDQGVSGGPDNPDTNGVFIFHEPVDLPTNFDIIVLSHDCFTYRFECRGEYVDTYEYFYWFMPDSIHRTEGPVFEYTFNPELFGNQSITALGHDVTNAEVYGFGQYTVNLDIVRINSLSTAFDNNVIPVPSVPFTFNILADIYHEDETPYTWEWSVESNDGVEYEMNGYETVGEVVIQKITSLPASLVVKYTLSACTYRVLEETITINLQTTDMWGYPNITFYPEPQNIIDTTSFFIISFDRIMLKEDNTELADSDLDEYFGITFPGCPDLQFIHSVDYNYATGETVIRIDQVYGSTQQPGMLCNGDYVFDVDYDRLFTQFYRLNRNDTSKTYYVCCNDIAESAETLDPAVYPNPFSHEVHITFDEVEDYRIELVNLQGVAEKSFAYSRISEVTINLENLSDGVYVLRGMNAKGTKYFQKKINKITH